MILIEHCNFAVVGDDDARPSASEVVPELAVPVLPPVDLVLENEIWQYRYPPFESLLAKNAPASEAVAQAPVLPDYVIGVLNASELIDTIFKPAGDLAGGSKVANQEQVVFERDAKPVDSDVRKTKSVRNSGKEGSFLARDDQWIWKG